jgi:hypothetical protein
MYGSLLAEYVKQVVNESARSHPFSDGGFFVIRITSDIAFPVSFHIGRDMRG